MGNLTYLKFFDADSVDVVNDLCKRGWKVKPAGETKSGSPICAVYINAGDERDIHILHCPECLEVEIEVYHLDWSMLTCPICSSDVAQEDWITEADMKEIRLEELRDREFYVPLTEGEIVEECDDEPA